MISLIVLFIPIALIAFWAWMFLDMTKNENLPRCYFTLTNGAKIRYDWTVALVVLSIFTAGYYFFTEYTK